MLRILYVFLGGGIGSIARYLITVGTVRYISPEFPLGTLLVNLIGCFCIGFIHTLGTAAIRLPPDAQLFLTSGVMGGLTTYSAFNYEALALFDQGRAFRAAGYMIITLAGCLGAGFLGIGGAKMLAAAR